MRSRKIVQTVLIALILAAGLAGTALAKTTFASVEGGGLLTASLNGAEEVSGPGDPDGSRTAVVSVKPSAELLCLELTASTIAPATAAHVHDGPAGIAGPVVMGLTPPTSD